MTRDEMILNETKRRMKALYEYSFYRNGVTEDDEQNGGNDPMGGGNGPMDGNGPMGGGNGPMGGGNGSMGGNDPMGGGNDPMGGDPMGGDPMGGGNDPMGGDPMGGGAPTGNGEIDGANLAPNAGMPDDNNTPMGGDPMGGDPMGGGQPGPDDDVVDVTELTDAQGQMQQTQQEMASQMSDVDEKLATLMKVMDKFTAAIETNDKKINDLKRELIKRTPTEEETMNVRLNAGGNPFDQKPEEFWDKFKDINNHYNITANNDAPQYQIRKYEIDNFNDRLIANEFDDIPDSLDEYFNR